MTRFRPAAGLLACLALAGCGTPPPPLVPASGVVTLNGKPAANLMLQFNPKEWTASSAVLSSIAVSDAEGRYVLKSSGGEPGVTPGTHQVTVVDNNLNVEDEPKPGAKRIVNRVPDAYTSAASTPLVVTVEAGKTDYPLEVRGR